MVQRRGQTGSGSVTKTNILYYRDRVGQKLDLVLPNCDGKRIEALHGRKVFRIAWK
jgi:hypothetical protein